MITRTPRINRERDDDDEGTKSRNWQPPYRRNQDNTIYRQWFEQICAELDVADNVDKALREIRWLKSLVKNNPDNDIPF